MSWLFRMFGLIGVSEFTPRLESWDLIVFVVAIQRCDGRKATRLVNMTRGPHVPS